MNWKALDVDGDATLRDGTLTTPTPAVRGWILCPQGFQMFTGTD